MTSPIANITPKAKYDQITVLGMATATTTEEFTKLLLTTISFPCVAIAKSPVRRADCTPPPVEGRTLSLALRAKPKGPPSLRRGGLGCI